MATQQRSPLPSHDVTMPLAHVYHDDDGEEEVSSGSSFQSAYYIGSSSPRQSPVSHHHDQYEDTTYQKAREETTEPIDYHNGDDDSGSRSDDSSSSGRGRWRYTADENNADDFVKAESVAENPTSGKGGDRGRPPAEHIALRVPYVPIRLQPQPRRTKLARVGGWLLFGGIVMSLPLLTLSLFVPLLNIVTAPLLLSLLVFSFYLIPCLAYLTLAQNDPPENARLPFLPPLRDWRLCVRINVVLLKWLTVGLRVIPGVLVDWCVRRVLESKDGNAKADRWGRRDISYGSFQNDNKLDVYRAQKRGSAPPVPSSLAEAIKKHVESAAHDDGRDHSPSTASSSSSQDASTVTYPLPLLAPMIVFVPSPHLGPVSQRKWMYESLGRNLASMGYTVVIPDVTRYPEGKAREMIGDVRKVMRWAEQNGKEWGGDAERVWLMGHSLGGHLALLTVLQDAVVVSRESILAQDGDDGEMSNGLRKLQVYEPEVMIPKVEGLILLAPICDVNEQIVQEARRGAAHLSKLRRILGPTHTTAMFHSPAHVLHASRNVVNVGLLPSKVLFIHGGNDEEVHHSQSELMKELMRGVGVADAQCLVYRVGHVDVMTALMTRMDEPISSQILEELTSFIPT